MVRRHSTTEFVFMNKELEIGEFCICTNACSEICIWGFPLMISPLVSFAFWIWLHLSYTRTGGLPHKHYGSYVCILMLRPPRAYFFIIFFCQLHKKAQWVSLIRILSHPFFRRFTFSYKKFKIDYFKVTIKSTSRNNFFFYSTGKPLFTFYWPQCPHWYNKYPKEYLTDEELWDLAFIKSLLCRLLARPVVSLIWSPNPIWDLNG